MSIVDIKIIEKYSPMLPYQVSKFSSKKAVKEYILSRKDIYGNDSESKPVITENNEIMGD